MRGFGRSSVPREVEAYGAKNVTLDLVKLLGTTNRSSARLLSLFIILTCAACC